MEISDYQQADSTAIKQLFVQTFSDAEGEAEGALIGQLVTELMFQTDPGDRYGIVACERERITGCVFLSRLSHDAAFEAFLLSPVAVATEYQAQGIGQRLVRNGIERLRSRGVQMLMTYGDPRFYARLGFRPVSEQVIKPPYALSQPEGWLCCPLNDADPEIFAGSVHCVPAFSRPELW